MQEVVANPQTDTEREFAELWEEITDTQEPPVAQEIDGHRAAIHVQKLDIEPMKPICRCWRCRAGGIAVSEMGPLDRILARYLLTFGEGDRKVWLREWAANPQHGQLGKLKLLAWIAIEQGEKRPEPIYFAKETA